MESLTARVFDRCWYFSTDEISEWHNLYANDDEKKYVLREYPEYYVAEYYSGECYASMYLAGSTMKFPTEIWSIKKNSVVDGSIPYYLPGKQ